ncbi:ribonuclease P protein component [Saccharomonospora iraqiensis]|uniref:ribonuclease P protein component n=1 Tax=Saccharomonospora iraqiensis TaxID=52698 RepID=UPI00022E38C4|nr:ribonuclease P protein component [Saccharomonospora iraqiensis]
MLPADARLRHGDQFRAVMRGGVRAGRRRLVVHLLPGYGERPRAGFVVSKAVGNSVVRHRVIRRLRHLVAARLGTLPEGSALVVRALPPASSATSAELGADLDAALRRLAGRSSTGPPGGRGRPVRTNDGSSA